jgi:hypothetical protein
MIFILSLHNVSATFVDSSVFVNLKLLEQRAEPPPVASSDVPMFCNNIDLNDLEQMDQMTQRVSNKNLKYKNNYFL